ncbi:hypothetical protein ACI7RC_21045 [Brevibacillus sp. B_LB10_24]|uniref:hypothetical protein n=1 Tax=Brevibacillus sp. B_LB10_24 TaxID=3380645 RepID=UPI0038B6E7DC
MNEHKSALVAFFLSFFPGVGHLYLNRKRGIVYLLVFIGLIGCGLCLAFLSGSGELFVFFLIIAFLVLLINVLDMLVALLRGRPVAAVMESGQTGGTTHQTSQSQQQNERFFTILLSFIPGLGHFQLGLMTRGSAFLIAFFGLAVMVLFVTVITGEKGFALFLGGLPIIWLSSLFDALQLLGRKERGEVIVDRSFFEELEENRDAGRKSGVLATFLSVIPGAGHMYLGLQRRGLQLMAAFVFSIYIMDVLRLSIFLFLIPIIWFYSFFDGLQQFSRWRRGEVRDEPVADWLLNHQKWIGIGLIGLGGYYLLDQVLLPLIEPNFPDFNISFLFHSYVQTSIVSMLLIGGGLKLLLGKKQREEGKAECDNGE